MGFVRAHPWLTLVLAVAGVTLLAERKKTTASAKTTSAPTKPQGEGVYEPGEWSPNAGAQFDAPTTEGAPR